MFKGHITDSQAKLLFDTAKGDINIIKEKYIIAQMVPNINNLVGWMIDAIKKDYQAPIVKMETSTFNDYEQRTYDYDKLEKQLLGWDSIQGDD